MPRRKRSSFSTFVQSWPVRSAIPRSSRSILAKLSELQNELRIRIAAAKEAAPEQRAQDLATFAAFQAPGILKLQNQAEKIRADLRRSGLFGMLTDDGDWPEAYYPQARPSNGTTLTPSEIRQEKTALRGAAYYQEGLSTAQRYLLLEAATELEPDSSSWPNTGPETEKGWLLHFSPEPARIRLIANLPAPLAKKISEYVLTKNNLKTALRDTLLPHLHSSSTLRMAAMKELAVVQAPRIAALELGAEDIRRDLADLPNPPGPPAPPSLPPELGTRISVYRTHKLDLLKTLYAMLTSKGKAASPARPAGAALDAQPWLRDGTTQTELPAEKLRVSTSEFNSTQTGLLEELNREQAGIREALATHFRKTNQPTDRKSINDLLKDFESSRQKQEIWEKYRDYQTAVLMPGLSAEQRRLLFDAAIEELALPLPAGEKLP